MSVPYVIVNAAMSVDGKLDTVERQGTKISSAKDKLRVDKLRAAVDAVLVGGNTLNAEDPSLGVRSPRLRAARVRKGLPENPARVGIVTKASLKPDGKFLMSGIADRIIFTTHKTPEREISELRDAGVKVFIDDAVRVNIINALEVLHKRGIQKILVEGGGTILAEFFRLALVDELQLYIAPRIFGGISAPSLVDGPGFLPGNSPALRLITIRRYDTDGGIFVHYKVQK